MIVVYFPSTLLIANYSFKHFGLHISLALGSGLNCLCLALRLLINQSFTLAMVGGFFYGAAQPLIFNANPEIATNWFAADEVRSYFIKF